MFYNAIGGDPSVMVTRSTRLELTSLLIYTEYNISVDAVTVLPGERSTAVTVFTDEDCKLMHLACQLAFEQKWEKLSFLAQRRQRCMWAY